MVQVGASELVISVAAEDVGISEVNARSEVSNVLGRLASDSTKHADTGGLEEGGGGVNKLADIVEHSCNKQILLSSNNPTLIQEAGRWEGKQQLFT